MDQLLYSNKTTNIIAETQFEYGSITTRPTAIPEISNINGTSFFTGMVVNDLYESDDLIINQTGVYSIYFYAQPYVYGGITTVSFVYGDEIYNGAFNPSPVEKTFDFYSPTDKTTIGKLTNIIIKNPTKIRLTFLVTGKNVASLGFRVSVGKILLVKNK
jgi:hypothetical protein